MRIDFEIINDPYLDPKSVYNITHYVTHDKNGRLLNFCGSPNTRITDPAGQMMYVKKYFGKEAGRQIRHFIVSFDRRLPYSEFELGVIGMKVCGYYSDRYQIIFGVHNNTDNLHIHFAMNTVSFIDGKMYSESHGDAIGLRKYIETAVYSF